MSMNAEVPPEVIKDYEAVKFNKGAAFIILKLSQTKVITEHAEQGKFDYAKFVKALTHAGEPRYGVCNIVKRKHDIDTTQLCFFFWAPDESNVKMKMLYASCKGGLKKKLDGIQQDFEVSDDGDLDQKTLLNNMH